MGNFYVNFTVCGRNQEDVAKSLRSATRGAYVGPTLNGLTVFFDDKADSQDETEIKNVGESISKSLNAPVLAVLNHDDDILAYWLFDTGRLLDEYNSCPGYFTDGDNAPAGGNAEKLCAAFNSTAIKEVDAVLHNEDYVFALERHEELSALLDLPWSYVCMGYGYIKEGTLAPGVAKTDLVQIN
jgi:hypothetical protein